MTLEWCIEWYGLTCCDLMQSGSAIKRTLGLVMAALGMVPLLVLTALWLLFGKKPNDDSSEGQSA